MQDHPPTARTTLTLADVARRAGVSRTTVSNAYNRPDQLSPAQRERVLRVATELGYAGPDPVARSLRTRSAGAVGLIFSAQLSHAFSDPAAVEFLHGVAQACEERDRSLLLIPAGPNAANTALVSRAAVDGFLIYSMPDHDPHVETVLGRPQSAVVVDSPTGIEGIDFVGIDDRQAFGELSRHVLGLGHRSVVVVSMGAGLAHQPEWSDFSTAPLGVHAVFRERVLGLGDAVTELGRPVRVALRTGQVNSVEVGRAVARELAQSDSDATAVMCTSDALAFGVLAELVERGIAVPGRISVTGFDDVPDAAARALTTVAQPTHEKGHRAASLLLDRDDEQRPARRILLPTRLEMRATTAPPPR
ncbi:MAG: LacI family DNA-binding transcriptional regulator [bacterium]